SRFPRPRMPSAEWSLSILTASPFRRCVPVSALRPRFGAFYGFVGRHEIARVPAEEMDFPATWNTGWSDLSRDLEARLVPPGGRDDGRLILTDPVPVGGPLPIVMSLRNRRGIAVTIPTDLARTGGGSRLRDGVSVRIFREPAPAREEPVAGLSQ